MTGDRILDSGCDPLEGETAGEGEHGGGLSVPVLSSSDDQEDGDTIHWSKNTADEVDFGGEMLTSLRT